MQFFHSIFGSLQLITYLSALYVLRNKPSSVIIHFLREVRYWHIPVKYQCLIFQVFISRFLVLSWYVNKNLKNSLPLNVLPNSN